MLITLGLYLAAPNLIAQNPGVDKREEIKYHKPFQQMFFKLSPVVGNGKIIGYLGMFETGTGLRRLSANLIYRNSNAAPDTTHPELSHLKHYSIELQTKVYFVHQLQGLYAAPIFGYYSTNELSAGVTLGIQKLIAHRFPLDIYIGIQKTTLAMPNDLPISYRFGFALGIASRKMDMIVL